MNAHQTKTIKALSDRHGKTISETVEWVKSLHSFRLQGGKLGCAGFGVLATDDTGEMHILYMSGFRNVCARIVDSLIAISAAK